MTLRMNLQLRLCCLGFIAFISFNSCNVSLTEEVSAEEGNKTGWIENAFIHSHHSAGSYGSEWEDEIALVHPDVMQFHEHAQEDGAELAKKFGFRLCFTINRSGEYDYGAQKYTIENGLFPRIDPDGNAYGREKEGRFVRHLCFNSPAVDKQLIPVYVAAVKKYHPAQIWIDSTVITVNYCYCPICTELFTKKTGHKPPVTGEEPYWREWIDFQRACFVNWMEKLSEKVHEVDPDVIVTFNHAYWVNQPEAPPSFIKNLSADIHSHSLLVGLYSRYATSVELPFDVMIGLSDTWAGHRLKAEQQLLEEVAATTACGGSWNIGEFPASRKNQPADGMLELANKAATFARERRQWTFHTQSVPCVAVLNSATTHYSHVPAPRTVQGNVDYGSESLYTDDGKIVQVAKNPRDSRIYWQQGKDAPLYLTGAYEALVENQIHFDIVNEEVLTRRIRQYELVILPEQSLLPEKVSDSIRDYVKNGGKVLATGSTIRAGMNDLFGLRETQADKTSAAPSDDDVPAFSNERLYLVQPTSAKKVQISTNAKNPPFFWMNTYGTGTVGYVNADVFSYYSDASPYNIYRGAESSGSNELFLNYLARIMDTLWPERRFSVEAPRWFDVLLRHNESRLLVQLLNRANAYHHSDDVVRKIQVDLAVATKPERVLLQPGNESISWNWENGRLKVSLSTAQVPVHRIIEISRGLKSLGSR
jgi:hypothetical protein